MSKIMYYFSTVDRRLRYGDNRPIVCGETHVVDTTERQLKLCAYGLHASPTPFQALDYAPGPVLWQVRLGGEVITGDDKSCASERTYLAEFDATAVLRTFARRQALIHIEKIRPYCAPTDYDLILTWLTMDNESLRSAAWSAAESAARSAARSAAKSAAWSAAYAAWSTAYAAESAARFAARSAARSAAQSAAYAAMSATWSTAQSAAQSAAYAAYAAESAAESAAMSAARSAASAILDEMIREATGWEV